MPASMRPKSQAAVFIFCTRMTNPPSTCQRKNFAILPCRKGTADGTQDSEIIYIPNLLSECLSQLSRIIVKFRMFGNKQTPYIIWKYCTSNMSMILVGWWSRTLDVLPHCPTKLAPLCYQRIGCHVFLWSWLVSGVILTVQPETWVGSRLQCIGHNNT